MLTDGGFWWGASGEELKRFCFADVMGISLARKAGILVALVSGEDTPLIDRFAQKLGISETEKNCKDKSRALKAFAQRHELSLEQMCFMGDDVNDLSAMKIAGLAAAPANGHPEVLRIASFISRKNGGNGAVRELMDALVSASAHSHTISQ